MCNWGTDEWVGLCAATPVQGRTRIKVDACIAPLVQMLNDYGIETIASCCGHGQVKESSIIVDAKNISLRPLDDGSYRAHLVFLYKAPKEAKLRDTPCSP